MEQLDNFELEPIEELNMQLNTFLSHGEIDWHVHPISPEHQFRQRAETLDENQIIIATQIRDIGSLQIIGCQIDIIAERTNSSVRAKWNPIVPQPNFHGDSLMMDTLRKATENDD